jgi:hypothetical protein
METQMRVDAATDALGSALSPPPGIGKKRPAISVAAKLKSGSRARTAFKAALVRCVPRAGPDLDTCDDLARLATVP